MLVVKDGAAWLPRCLRALARQTHPRLGVVAIDNGSVDGSWSMLADALGRERVLRLDRNIGFAEAVSKALASRAAARADYYLLIHDDAVLAPSAVERMVECAERIRGTGVVGPKVLDGQRPRVLREVGLATDRFGYPHSPLEEDELDQGQYDTIREVLFVSTTAMLIARDAWLRAGALDERLVTTHGDLDFCWRVRLAGFRVVVDPRAVVHHFSAGERGDRSGSRAGRGRYLAERAGLLGLLKNYRLISLAWILPLYLLQGLVKIAVFVAGRRFSTAGQILAAWGWNLAHLPGTIRRRVRGHGVRTVKDRAVLRFMAPAGERARRLVQEGSLVLFGRGEEIDDPVERRAIAERVSSFVLAHPVALGWTAAVALTLIAFRDVLFGPMPSGGALPVFPERAADLLRAFLEDWHEPGFGTSRPASPALVPLGLASFATLGNPRLLARVLVAAGPLLAGVACYRAALRLTSVRVGAVVAAACYAASAVVLWAASEGRVGAIVYLVALPWIAARTLRGFAEPAARPLGWMLATGAVVGLTAAFFPSAWIGLALCAIAAVPVAQGPRSAIRGLGLAIGGLAAGAALIAPFAIRLASGGGPGAADAAGDAVWPAILRLSPGEAPGSWAPALFLPLAGTIAFALADERRRAWWGALAAALALPAAWFAAAGGLPEALSSPVAFIGAAAVTLSFLVAFAFRSVLPATGRRAFGTQQVAFALLVLVVGAGLAIQSVRALGGGWAVGRDRVPPAWPVVATAEPRASFRVLWLADGQLDAFPPPGGGPDGEMASAAGRLRYAITTRHGRPATAIAAPADGPGYRRLEDVIVEVADGTLRHAGASLATLGIRYVVSPDRSLPPPLLATLDGQADLDLIQSAGGLRVYRTARPFPHAWTAPGDAVGIAARRDRPESLVDARASRLAPHGEERWGGSPPRGGGVAVLSESYDAGWRLDPGDRRPFRAFGWSPGFDVDRGSDVTIAFEGGNRRLLETLYLIFVWGVTMWLTRRRGELR